MVNDYQRKLKGNIWKYFVVTLTQRRNFLPILAIYFLTFPDSTVKQIGIYTGLGYLASFLLEIPTGYFSDKFGQKNTLIIAKFSMLLSTLCFLIGNSLIWFIFGSILISTGFAFDSGTKQVFMHNTLKGLRKGKKYVKTMGKISANVSLISVALIIIFPFFTSINILLPILICLILDVIGLFVVISLVEPNQKLFSEKVNFKTLKELIKKSRKSSFYIVALYTGLICGFVTGSGTFKELYAISQGLPIIFAGFAMGLSRLIWFFIGHNAHKILEKITFKQLMKLEMIIFPAFLILLMLASNPYLIIILYALMSGYYMGRSQVEEYYFLHTYTFSKQYKATTMSIQSQVGSLIQFIVVFGIGFVMNINYKLGNLILGITLFALLAITYHIWNRYENKTPLETEYKK